MKKIKYSEERFMSILWDLYRNTTNGETIIQYGEFCRQHQVTNAMFPILVKHKVLHKEKISRFGRGKLSNVYTWSSIQPNIHMANKLMEEIKKTSKEANQKHRERKLQEKLLEQQSQQPYEVVELQENTMIQPVYEIKETPNVDVTQTIYDVSVPVEQPNNVVTLSTDATSTKKIEPKQKSVSILWGLISIKW